VDQVPDLQGTLTFAIKRVYHMGIFGRKKADRALDQDEQNLFNTFLKIAKVQLIPTHAALTGLDANLIESQKLICYIYYDILAAAIINDSFKPERRRDLMRAMARDVALDQLEKSGFAQYRTYHNQKENFETAPLVHPAFKGALERDMALANRIIEGAEHAVQSTLEYLAEGQSEKVSYGLGVLVLTSTSVDFSD
jgi:hypothetical protein